jgi:hypothetical protein
MRHIYMLKYPNYDIDKNKIEITTLLIIVGFHGLAGSKKVNPPRTVLFCVYFSSFCSYFLTQITFSSFYGSVTNKFIKRVFSNYKTYSTLL